MIAAIPMAKVTTVEHRIRALLDHRRSRSGLTRLHAIAAFSAAVAIVLPLAMVSLRAIDSPGTPTASADGALPDRTTPESAINSFVDALNRFDLRSARACIFGVNPAAVSPEFERQLKQVRPILTLRDVRTVTEGERSIVMIGNGTVSDSDNVSDKDRPSVHSVKDQRLELRRDGGVWRIVPGDLKHIDRAGGEPALAGIVAILAAPEPALAHARVKAQATLCANHLRQLAVAAHMYANAHAGRLDFAPGDPATALAAYTDNQKVSSCPDAVSKTPYRFNAKLVDAEIDRIAEPNKTVLFYEPAAIGAQLDYHHNDRTNIAFVDGHVQACDREETAKLRWDP